MFRYITVLLAFVACISAKPGILTPISYSSPLFAATSQLDIRNGLSGAYATSLGYTSPLAARVAASPFAYTTPVARFASPAISFGAPVAKYASPLAAAAAYAAPYSASYGPFAASPYASAFGAPYALAAPAAGPILL